MKTQFSINIFLKKKKDGFTEPTKIDFHDTKNQNQDMQL